MVISNFVSQDLNGKPPEICRSGEQIRGFTYVNDAVPVNRTLMRMGTGEEEVMNVDSTGTSDIRTLTEEIREAIDPELEIEYTEARTGDAKAAQADASRATELVCYEPRRSRRGIERFIEWYEANREWYEPLVLRS
ncbi:Rossmann-fold NAD(P)-binding domain-containing protein [Natronorubrum tibetense]|uniref:NAD-dependent epimerase/dehydratase n=1 Tax=Natronorubrum tibetense GA33 TaxID=1114856 RepID=L9VKT1_9EURY|nr:hypothetical protein [Natronorubrum tibetense]ELY37676.1 NAD-dependent epimerase/dehydratase [Natronorubrum tibetense GA33]